LLCFAFQFGLFADLDEVLNLFDNVFLEAVFVAVIIIGLWISNVEALDVFAAGSEFGERSLLNDLTVLAESDDVIGAW
jgi:hypothetical protein